jgi:hypothetical protein
MPVKFTNNATADLASSITNVATTITVTTGQGARFPSLSAGDFFYATLVDSSNNLEIVRCTARSSDTLTVVRGQDGTTARAYNSGDKIELRPVAAAWDTMVQTDSTQTISGNKTYSGNVTFNNTITGSISGNAATVTNGVYTTGDQNIAGSKRFSSSVVVGGTGTAATSLDVQTTGANTLTSTFTTGLSDTNFRIGSMNGVSGGTSGTSQGMLGLFYLGTGEAATIQFRRGSTTTDASFAFRTSGSDRATLDNSGNFTATGNVTAYSDRRLKSDIRTLEHSIDTVKRLRGVAFVKDGKAGLGVIAQEVQEVLPQVVHENADGYLSVAYGNLVGVLIEAVKELSAKVEALEAK